MADAIAVGKKIRRRVDKIGVHKYQAVLPDPLFDELQRLADENHTTIADLLRRFVKLGLIAADLEESGGSLVLKRPGFPDERIVFLV